MTCPCSHPRPDFSDRMGLTKFFVNSIKPSHPILIANIAHDIIPVYLKRENPVKPKPVEPKPVEPKPVEPKPVEKKEKEKEEGGGGSSLWFIVILVMAIILMNSYKR